MTRYARLLLLALLTLAVDFWALAAPCWAQAYGEEVPEKSYVPCYIVVIMAVVLGLTAICRMGKRSSDIRRTM